MGPPDEGADPLAWCHTMFHAVAGELARREPAEPAWTWWEPEQTVGFWLRRMAHETAVHRADIESASGRVTPIASDLAVDGVDELLAIHLPDDGFADPTRLAVADGMVDVVIAGVTVTGEPSDVLLWLWGRLGDEAVAVGGQAADVKRIREELRRATQ